MNFNLTLFGQTFAFILFVWFCMKYIWPVLLSAIEARQTTIADGLAAGEKGQAALVEAKTEAGKIVGEARQQAKTILDQAQTRAGEIVDTAKADGEAERKRQLEAARAEIAVAENKARDELRGQVAAIAIAGAEQILSREIKPETHRELLAGLAAKL